MWVSTRTRKRIIQRFHIIFFYKFFFGRTIWKSPTSTNRRICIRYLTINNNENEIKMVSSIFHIYLLRVVRSFSCIPLRLQVNAIGFVAAAANVTAAGVVVDFLFLFYFKKYYYFSIVCHGGRISYRAIVCKCQRNPDCSILSEWNSYRYTVDSVLSSEYSLNCNTVAICAKFSNEKLFAWFRLSFFLLQSNNVPSRVT